MSLRACRQEFSDTILEKAKQDKQIVVVTSDSRGSAAITKFAEELPEQFIDVGIAEQNAVGVAAGLAATGKKVYVVGPASFYSTRSAEQVKVDVAYSQNNVKVIGISGGISYGALGATHHSVQDIALMRAIPGLDVVLPADAAQMKRLVDLMLERAVPAYIRIGRGGVEDVYSKEDQFEWGKARKLKAGKDVAIIACGEAVWHAVKAAELLDSEGIRATVLDMFCIKPLDRQAVLDAARECGAVLTVEEHSIYGGLGGAVCEVLAQEHPVKVKVTGLPDEPLINGVSSALYQYYGIDAKGIVQNVKELLGKK